MGRMASRVLTSLALLCATLAWVGWVYLHTIGDPARSENIATAMLADPAANDQIASNFALQIVRASGIDRSNIDLVESAVSAALEDPRVTTDVISAFGAAHANALGVEDERSTTIDTNAMVTAVRERLAAVSPEIAAQLPDGVLPEITLPTYHPPGVGTVRTAAESATSLLAIVASLKAAPAADRAWADAVLADIGRGSPLALRVTEAAIRRAASLDLRATLAQDYRLAYRFVEEADIQSGVRATLIDKTGTPRWQYERIEDVSDARVAAFFASLGEAELALPTRVEMQAARV